MRNILLLVLVMNLGQEAFSQNYANDDNYFQIILDGEEAYINKETGEMIISGHSLETTTIHLNENDSHILNPINQKTTHVVKKDENLFRIAKKYNVSMGDLLSANNLTKNSTIGLGQTLIIPTSSHPKSISYNSNSYQVKKGDTLYSIAKRFGVSVSFIISRNGLSSNTIQPNQILKVK